MSAPDVAIIGAGPAGLIAAERLAETGYKVALYERMASPARKFLLAGRGGLNLTHSEPLDVLLGRYGAARTWLEPAIQAFPPQALRDWADGLGAESFVGSSGRVFPKAMKASPLLRAWLARLAGLGVQLHAGRLWTGWDENGALRFSVRGGGEEIAKARATLLALGGASWPRLGADGSWAALLEQKGIAISPLRPANAGFTVAWSALMRDKFAGLPLKRIALSFAGQRVPGEIMIDAGGIEGGAVYALSGPLRDAIARDGKATLMIDLRPDLSEPELANRLAKRRPGETLSNHLRKAAGLSPVAVAVLREAVGGPLPAEPEALASLIKAAPLRLNGMASLARAISTAGGVRAEEIDRDFMLKRLPGTFIAGEMLDWEAQTGGYLLQACFATGVAAAEAIGRFLTTRHARA
ncbi:TIGR03862 family flavoprotein [Bosea sp. NPDC003192]|uniref:TIGR03862 family flavoprotein n=1 Tax=Bosea sp. NPDC003192 TaxID=3390551 RepID=UPI003CFCEEAB